MEGEGEYRITAVTPIPQDPKTQWKILSRCPFGKELVENILKDLEKLAHEQEEQKDAAPVRQSAGDGPVNDAGHLEHLQEQKTKDGARSEENGGGDIPPGYGETCGGIDILGTVGAGQEGSPEVDSDASSRSEQV
jgi:hypothetical protein